MSNVAPSSVKIQIESIQTGNPVSESALAAIGGATNYCLENVMPVGSILSSFLDEPTFQGQTSTNWVLCDGRSASGTQFQALTSLTNVPDMRGRYARMKDNGSGNDTHGDLPLGDTYTDQNNEHVHGVGTYKVHAVEFGSGGTQVFNSVLYGSGGAATVTDIGNSLSNSSDVPSPVGTTVNGTEVNPKTVVVNYFVRIN